ncbi:DUF3995 domain-containing protein [Streptomyces sp. NPDC051207]|uniref:DUF3995 domain-containing protein n=1 Tax=Streptomyces sp. NPDC051207 TaxID=3154641 RepID=UPI0034345BC3
MTTLVRTLVPAVLTAALVVIGVLHLVWAFSPWPLDDEVSFSRTVLGSDSGEMPPPALSALVGLALIAGALLMLMVNRTVPAVGPAGLRTLAGYALVLVLLGRGLGGFLLNSGATDEFQRWNSALYSPLCVVLGLLGAVVMTAGRRLPPKNGAVSSTDSAAI